MYIYIIQSMKTSFYIKEFKLCNFTLCVYLYLYVHAEVGFIFVMMKKKLWLPEHVSGLYDNCHEIIIRWRVCLECFVLLNSTCTLLIKWILYLPGNCWGGGSAGNSWLKNFHSSLFLVLKTVLLLLINYR